MKLTRKLALGMAVALLTQGGHAAPANFMDVATSPKGSTNSDMFRDVGRVCGEASYLRQRQTSGSVENLDLLLSNQVSLAFVQLDVLKARDQIERDPRAKDVRVLLPLNFDEIHLIARPAKKDFLGRTKGVTKFTDLKSKKLGAWGGSVITAKVAQAKSKLNFSVVPYKTREETLAALAAGKVDAVLAVVGQPADWVKALNPAQNVLIPLDLPQGTLSGFYRPATLRYPGFSDVPTYAVQRILATRNFTDAQRRAVLLRYQKCAFSKLSVLQQTPGMHPKWTEVTFKEQDWPLFK
ncbi:MAG: TAXI family TRAP transporter solute-binding subunit [Deinococcus sp.]|uniref:TAXI family TRAP transporter solute-binding subunit n=1 Tax=Deinococcus sp. TaxID=47478 RepID=UPI0026DB93F5|nr:TAXI family TRAP transporter solute-binding subunit [Deinococcus sp.]MDO4246365.1 TAXI family TRAP transporter solute-binding subunit [Deinococcus sp.]